MQITSLAVVLTAISMSLINVFVFVILNHKSLTKKYNDAKRKKRIDEMLNHAVNKHEINYMLRKNKES